MTNKTALGNMLDQLNSLSPLKTEHISENNEPKKSAEEIIISVNPETIENWEFSDRPQSELGDIKSLANDMLNIGQQQPCIVRPHPKKREFYELIVGERRWRASKLLGLKLKVVVKKLSDIDAALAQATENDNRVDLSDYAKGMSFHKLINQGIIKQKDLIGKLGKSKQYVSSLLSFGKIPNEIITSVGDFSMVSARTAETIKQLSFNGEEYINALISLSQEIRTWKLGHKKLKQKIEQLIKKQEIKRFNIKVYDKEGRHIFTWKRTNNHSLFIVLPKKTIDLIDAGQISFDKLTENFKEIISMT